MLPGAVLTMMGESLFALTHNRRNSTGEFRPYPANTADPCSDAFADLLAFFQHHGYS